MQELCFLTALSLPGIMSASEIPRARLVHVPCGRWQVNIYLKTTTARRGADWRRGAIDIYFDRMGPFDVAQPRRRPEVTSSPPERFPAPCPRAAPSFYLMLHARYSVQDTALNCVPRLRSAWCTGLLQSSGAAPGGQAGQLARPSRFSAAMLAASAGSPAVALQRLVFFVPCLFCALPCLLCAGARLHNFPLGPIALPTCIT